MPPSPRLSLGENGTVAARVLAAEGPQAVTMRRLAKECDVGPMTLYGYVRTKEEIFSALFDRGIAGIALPPAGTPWPVVARQIFTAAHGVFTEHPELAGIIVAQPMEGPAARAATEAVQDALRTGGIDPEPAFDALANYTFGASRRSAPERFAAGLEIVIAGIAAPRAASG